MTARSSSLRWIRTLVLFALAMTTACALGDGAEGEDDAVDLGSFGDPKSDVGAFEVPVDVDVGGSTRMRLRVSGPFEVALGQRNAATEVELMVLTPTGEVTDTGDQPRVTIEPEGPDEIRYMIVVQNLGKAPFEGGMVVRAVTPPPNP